MFQFGIVVALLAVVQDIRQQFAIVEAVALVNVLAIKVLMGSLAKMIILAAT